MSLLQENVYFFYGKVNKNAYFTLFQVNKNVNLVIFNMSKIAFCRFRDVLCAVGTLLIFWFCFIVFDFIRFMLLGSPPFSGGSVVMLVVLFSFLQPL